MKKIIILTGGGTMGHISPNLALLESLYKTFDEVHYIGSKSGIEKTKIEEEVGRGAKITYHAIPATKLNRSNIFKNFFIRYLLRNYFLYLKRYGI